ncbi:MAG: cation transporter [Pseudonocardiaceae bacterium]|nr:cation transporter [Pseudonocardiaceae bacterium]
MTRQAGPRATEPDASEPDATAWRDWDTPRDSWLRTDDARPGWKRSVLLEVVARVLFPTVLALSLYLLFAGHHDTGGGFTGGLVAGLAFVLRYVAGGPAELSAVVRIRPPVVVGIGLTIAAAVAIAPLAFGTEPLTAAVAEPVVPVLGKLKLATSLLLDIGVYLLVVGVVLDLLRTLGAGIEHQRARDRAEEEG